MFSDLRTMAWKEAKEQFRGQGKRSNYLRQLVAPVVLAAVFPITWGPDWVNEFPALIIAFITPAVIVGVMIPDSFAGERERHTLNTLLASRLPDNAIFVGKMLLPILVGWGGALGLTAVSLVVVNIAHRESGLLLYSPVITTGIIFLSFLSATLMSGGGILTSLSASSAQEAAQRLMMFVLVPAMIVQIVPMLLRDQIVKIINVLDGNQLLALFSGFLLVVDLVVFLLAKNKFKRSLLFLQ
jgi:ABC-2 type transport system permease protein